MCAIWHSPAITGYMLGVLSFTFCFGIFQTEGTGTVELRASGPSQYDYGPDLREKLPLTCSSCGYNPKASCECPICQGSCKAKTSTAGDPPNQQLKKDEALRKRLVKRAQQAQRGTFASVTTVPIC